MITWGEARAYVAGLWGASAWDNLQPGPKRIAEASIRQAVERVWHAMHPDARVKDGMIEVKPRVILTDGVTAVAGENFATVDSADVDGTVQAQEVFFADEAHRIDKVEALGGDQWKLWFVDPVRDDVTAGTGHIDYVRYLLPLDFEAFDEIPGVTAPISGTADADQYMANAGYQISVHGWIEDYVSAAGTVKVTNGAAMTEIQGQLTAWTSALAGQVMRIGGAATPLLIRSVDTTPGAQKAYPWLPYATAQGETSATSAVSYSLDLQRRRWARVYSSEIRDIHFAYRTLPPPPGRDSDEIPLPISHPFYEALQYYWKKNDAACGASASDVAAALMAMERALGDVYESTKPYATLPERMVIDLRQQPNVPHRDSRVSYYRRGRDGAVSYTSDNPLSRHAR